ncbi:MAG: formylglycine-generating enzyme family protein [Oligoflexia bacterium]|nr:formylglycine-generating enzyme family protein [Oligoflexia bacterium]
MSVLLFAGCVLISCDGRAPSEAAGDTGSTETDAGGIETDAGSTKTDAGSTETNTYLDGALGLVAIPAGTFTMGSPDAEVGRDADETQHEVTLTHDFFIGSTEVTQGQFIEYMGYNPSYFSSCGETCPVEYLTWHQAAAFANAVSAAAGLSQCYTCMGTGDSVTCDTSGDPYSCEGYRLPTEAEWEYAARATETAAFLGGGNLVDGDQENCKSDVVLDNGDLLGDFAWYCGNADSTSHAVAGLDPNFLGLFDTSGNVWEWCDDWYDSYGGDEEDPVGASSGVFRVYRGGSWINFPRRARLAHRLRSTPGSRSSILGFRLSRRGAAPSLP